MFNSYVNLPEGIPQKVIMCHSKELTKQPPGVSQGFNR